MKCPRGGDLPQSRGANPHLAPHMPHVRVVGHATDRCIMQRYLTDRGCPFIQGDAPPSACPLLSQKLHDTLEKYWHHPTFRDGQLEALMPILHGNDVFVRMGQENLYACSFPHCLLASMPWE